MEAIEILLLQIAVILLLSRLLGAAMRLIHQPQVVGEMIAGIMLGPSLLGLFHHGAWMHALFPAESSGNLNVLAQLGVMLFMFLVGLELDPKLLRGQGRAALVTGTVGIVIPFIGGATLALGLIKTGENVTGPVSSTLVLALFMGAAMSITAFPVLARILTERNLHKTKSGALALTCAAMDDVMGWCILAFVLAVAHLKGFGTEGHSGGGSSGAVQSAIRTVLLSVAFILVMALVVRKLLAKLEAHFEARGYLSQNILAVIFLLLLGSSLATAVIGIHQIFGAFLLGAVMPKNGAFIKHLSEKVEDFTILFLLPLFFAYTGLRTEFGLLGTPGAWGICAIIVFVAILGKFGGVSLAARFYGMSWRKSSLLGVLMNTRGLMELIILNIGYTYHVLSSQLFAMMVVMALLTTVMTTPFMRLIYSPARQKKELEEAAREEAEKVDGVNVIVPVSRKSSARSLARMGTMLMAADPGRLYALHLDRPEEVEHVAKGVPSEAEEVLDMASEVAKAAHVPISAVSFVSHNIGRDIADAAKRYRASWVVMGWHQQIFFKSVLGATVGNVMRQAPANVAVLVDKGLGRLTGIVVPYLGAGQDRGALIAAERLSHLPGVSVTILHVVKPGRGAAERLDIEAQAKTEFPIGLASGAVRMQVVESDAPIKLIVEESSRYDLMVLGLSPEWNIQNTSLFKKQQSVAQMAKCSLLIVHANSLAPVVRTQLIPETPAEPATAVDDATLPEVVRG